MKIVIIDTYYPGFLRSFWSKHKSLVGKSYSTQLKMLLAECFGTSDYYSYNLTKLGHKAIDIIANDEISQRKWAEEHSIKVGKSNFYSKLQMLPFIHRLIGRPTWIQDIVIEQVKFHKPDVVYLQDLSILNLEALKTIKEHCHLLVGQIASPMPDQDHLKSFDLILTSFPHYVSQFHKMGIKSEYFRIGFESRLIKTIGVHKRKYDVVFVGSFSPHHKEGTKILEQVASTIPVHVWGNGLEFLSPTSPLRKHYHGEAWGIEMYKVLAQSKIVLNRHIGVSEDYANNMRLYESTGMGAMLITDSKKNLSDLFKENIEVVSYSNTSDLIDKIRYFLKNPDKIKKISKAGQKRTLSEHSYKIRMGELVNILGKYL